MESRTRKELVVTLDSRTRRDCFWNSDIRLARDHNGGNRARYLGHTRCSTAWSASLVPGRQRAAHERWAALILEGIVGIAAAAVTAIFPGYHGSGTGIPYCRLGFGHRSSRDCCRNTFACAIHLPLSGCSHSAASRPCCLAFSPLLLPLAGAVAIALGVGIYALVFGVLLIGLGFRLRSWTRTPHAGATFPLPAR